MDGNQEIQQPGRGRRLFRGIRNKFRTDVFPQVPQPLPSVEKINPPSSARRDNSGRMSAVERGRLYTVETPPLDGNVPGFKLIITREQEEVEPTFTQQEAAVYNYVLLNAVENFYTPEDSVGEGVTAADVGKILEDQAQKLDKNFRKVVSNGPDYYLRIRSQVFDKVKKGEESGKSAADVIGLDFEDLSLALASFNKDELQGVLDLVSEKTPEQIIDEEFPVGVSEEKPPENVQQEVSPERTVGDEIRGFVNQLDSLKVYDVKSGVRMFVPFKFFPSMFDTKNFAKATELGIISPVGKDRVHQMDKFSRRDVVKLYWAFTYYPLRSMQRLSDSQKAELDDIGRNYDAIMEEKRAQQASTVTSHK